MSVLHRLAVQANESERIYRFVNNSSPLMRSLLLLLSLSLSLARARAMMNRRGSEKVQWIT